MSTKRNKRTKKIAANTNNNSSNFKSTQKDDANDSELDFIKIKKLDIKFRTKSQEELWKLIDNKEIVLCAGSAGTGKSYLSILKALELLQKEPTKYKKIILTTPVVEADEKLGFLPGDINEKMAPYTYSSLYLFEKILGKEKAKRMFDREQVKIIPFAYMRGINIDNAIVIADEVQNTTKRQILTLLSRIGENAKFILNGDLAQSDRFSYSNIDKCGLKIAMDLLDGLREIGIFEFTDSDIVRNPIITKIIDRFKE